MPLDLVGKLHRTVYITDCPEDSQEDLLHMLLKRCGAIEAWDVVDGRLVVVFRSMNSVSNALTFHGMSFVDLTRKICVWKATDAPPAEATHQLAIQGGSATAEAAPMEATSTEEEDSRRAQRKERRAALQQILNSGVADLVDTSSLEGRQAKMTELCYRQLKALCVLSAAAAKDARAELEEKKENLARLQDLIRTQEAAPKRQWEGSAEVGEEEPARARRRV
ncbi:hypothetical protein conserved [Leishmania donovani]|uniref:Hypothetical_protein_conserved n=1 Tax=Leishmania donovani TaxID=5661 RepID=A0A504XTZ4_LEIDO|nr:hypothetical protein CGC20_5665 [Leishmania donovani]CAJ1989837.1 hypothetical protein conserved [Leishmania donovani]VDZ45700.1 hypothetical_protein_conserved [Leishmania donovani]